MRKLAIQIGSQIRNRDAKFLQQWRYETVALLNEGEQQMFAVHLLMRAFVREPLRVLQCRLSLGGQSVQLHSPLSCFPTR